MLITTYLAPDTTSPDLELLQLLAGDAHLAAQDVHFQLVTLHDRNEIAQIANAEVRAELLANQLPLVVVDGVIHARRRLLTGAEYEQLIDGLSIQE